MHRRMVLFAPALLFAGCGSVSRVRVQLGATPGLAARIRVLSAAWVPMGAERPSAVDRLLVPGDLALPGRLERDLGDSSPQWLVVRAYGALEDRAVPIAEALLLLPARRNPRHVYEAQLNPVTENDHDSNSMVVGI
ncbi:MAG: hypothetical protein ACK6CU_18455 [Deltaproteobacteria bacterium]|jgi:hypothetical protein